MGNVFDDLLGFVGGNSDTIQGLMSLYGIYDSVSNANDASDSLEGLTTDQIERANQLTALYAEGGDVLRTNIKNLLEEYGNFGQVTPDIVDSFTEYFAKQRAAEETANIASVDSMTGEDKRRLMGFEDAYRDYMTGIINSNDDATYSADRYAKDTAPSTLDFARLQDDLTMKFYGMRKQMGDRAIAVQQAKVDASMPAGLERSTLAVQAARSMADLQSQQESENILAAIGDAQNYIAGLQNSASNEQNLTNAERNMQRNLRADVLNNAASEANIALTGGAYGQDYASNINSLRPYAIGELGAQQGLRNNTAITDAMSGLNYTSAENTLANSYIGQVGGLVTSPYSFTADGTTGLVNTSGTLSALGNLTENYATIASSNMAGAGDFVRSLKV